MFNSPEFKGEHSLPIEPGKDIQLAYIIIDAWCQALMEHGPVLYGKMINKIYTSLGYPSDDYSN